MILIARSFERPVSVKDNFTQQTIIKYLFIVFLLLTLNK